MEWQFRWYMKKKQLMLMSSVQPWIITGFNLNLQYGVPPSPSDLPSLPSMLASNKGVEPKLFDLFGASDTDNNTQTMQQVYDTIVVPNQLFPSSMLFNAVLAGPSPLNAGFPRPIPPNMLLPNQMPPNAFLPYPMHLNMVLPTTMPLNAMFPNPVSLNTMLPNSVFPNQMRPGSFYRGGGLVSQEMPTRTIGNNGTIYENISGVNEAPSYVMPGNALGFHQGFGTGLCQQQAQQVPSGLGLDAAETSTNQAFYAKALQEYQEKIMKYRESAAKSRAKRMENRKKPRMLYASDKHRTLLNLDIKKLKDENKYLKNVLKALKDGKKSVKEHLIKKRRASSMPLRV